MLNPDSFILKKTVTAVAVMVQLFSVYLFFRGHNQPGGGFIAGVATSVGILLLVIGHGRASLGRFVRFDPLRLSAAGLAIAFASSLIGPLTGQAFLTHFHYKDTDFPVLGTFYAGTPMLFDLGVFLTVVGVILKTSFVLLDALNRQADTDMPVNALPQSDMDEPLERSKATEPANLLP